jgi:hypothetical protein
VPAFRSALATLQVNVEFGLEARSADAQEDEIRIPGVGDALADIRWDGHDIARVDDGRRCIADLDLAHP